MKGNKKSFLQQFNNITAVLNEVQFPIKQWGHEDESNKRLIYPDFIRKGKAFNGLLYIHIWGGKVNIYDNYETV